ncbi:hypothetical protein J6590_076333 [Homalodisca vitripennis]|nr:hypothetical protein J6590_076333 [Homalodisca vitripennis]
MGKGPPPVEVNEEVFREPISSHVLSEERDSALKQPLVLAGRGWHTLMLARPFDSYETNPTNSNRHLPQYARPIELPLLSRISTFAVRGVPLLDIHKGCPDLTDRSVFALPSIFHTLFIEFERIREQEKGGEGLQWTEQQFHGRDRVSRSADRPWQFSRSVASPVNTIDQNILTGWLLLCCVSLCLFCYFPRSHSNQLPSVCV